MADDKKPIVYKKDGTLRHEPFGRPTKYREEMCFKVHDYLEENKDVTFQVLVMENEEKGYQKYENRTKVYLPTIEGFARYLGINKDTLYEWKDKYPLFSDSLDLILEEQQRRLINQGLDGTYNSTIAKLILSSNHGMSDRVANEHSISANRLNEETTEAIDDVYGTDDDESSV